MIVYFGGSALFFSLLMTRGLPVLDCEKKGIMPEMHEVPDNGRTLLYFGGIFRKFEEQCYINFEEKIVYFASIGWKIER